jgi:hypothetical protein
MTTATTFNASLFASALVTADKNDLRVPAVKMAIACYAVAHNMEKGANIALCCDLYGVPANQRTKANRDSSRLYNQAKGYWKTYVKFVNDNRQYLTDFFDSIKKLELKGTFAQIGDKVLNADIYGAGTAPQGRVEWLAFLEGYLPANAKKEKPSKDAKSEPVKGKDKEGGAAKRAADDNVSSAVKALVSKLEDHTQALINNQLEALDAAGLPKAHRAKVSKAMLALSLEIQKDIEKQLSK